MESLWRQDKGVALEFELDDDVVEEVRYSSYRLRMDIEKALTRGWFTEQEAHEIAITKSIHWKYEDEVRVFLKLSECPKRDGLFFHPLSDRLKITGIVLGPLCELSKAEVQKALSKGDRIEIVWTRLAFTSFNVVANRAQKKQTIYA